MQSENWEVKKQTFCDQTHRVGQGQEQRQTDIIKPSIGSRRGEFMSPSQSGLYSKSPSSYTNKQPKQRQGDFCIYPGIQQSTKSYNPTNRLSEAPRCRTLRSPPIVPIQHTCTALPSPPYMHPTIAADSGQEWSSGHVYRKRCPQFRGQEYVARECVPMASGQRM